MQQDQKLDAGLLARASFEYKKEQDKFIMYFNDGSLDGKTSKELAEAIHERAKQVTVEEIAKAATTRAEEFGKPVKGYAKELEILVEKLKSNPHSKIIESNYTRLLNYDRASEIVNDPNANPFEDIV